MERAHGPSLSICSLSVESISSPVHTYYSNSVSTTVEYVVGNHAISNFLTSCRTIEDHPLNTSDHLPLSINLHLKSPPSAPPSSKCCSPLNWRASVTNGSSVTYANRTDDLVCRLIDKDYSSIDELDLDLSFVSQSLLSLSESTIPHGRRPHRPARAPVRDPYLSSLCWHSRVAFREWKDAGRPRSGPV